MRVLIFGMYDQSLFFPFNNGALTGSGTNHHDDSLTYCDALFIFCLRLITSYQLTTITLKCVWITSGEDCKGGGNGSYIANPSRGGCGSARDSAILWECSAAVAGRRVCPEGG